MADWNSAQYLKFAGERTQPSLDLVNRIIGNPQKLVDIGCGPGNSTEVLARRFPNAAVIGVDNSPNMIESARKQHPELTFELCDVSTEVTTLGNDFDVIFSNACIQWVPDHPKLLRNLLGLLKPGGQLAVQIPNQDAAPIHRILRETADSAEWKDYFSKNPRTYYSLTAEGYFDLLAEIASEFNIWETTYFHIMNTHRDILEWYRGTGMRPYLSALPEEKREAFEREVYKRTVETYPVQKNGQIIFRFPRLFFTARP